MSRSTCFVWRSFVGTAYAVSLGMRAIAALLKSRPDALSGHPFLSLFSLCSLLLSRLEDILYFLRINLDLNSENHRGCFRGQEGAGALLCVTVLITLQLVTLQLQLFYVSSFSLPQDPCSQLRSLPPVSSTKFIPTRVSMAAANNPNSHPSGPSLHAPTTPYPPSPVEAQYYYYGIPSQPRLVARSSSDLWVEPTGAAAYLNAKEASPLGIHPLREIWEAAVGPAIIGYLDTHGVKYTSLDPVRMGHAGDSSPPAIIWMGVVPGSLATDVGIEIATGCKGILCDYEINDVHVEIRESEVFRSAKMYKPVTTSNTTVQMREAFSTALGLPISTEDDPTLGGTGGFFMSDRRYPGTIYLVTARHVVIHADKDNNLLYKKSSPSQPSKRVILFSDPAFENHIEAIKLAIRSKETVAIKQLESRMKIAQRMEGEDGEAERDEVRHQLEKVKKSIEDLRAFLAEVSRVWKDRKDRVLGEIIIAPPIGLNIGEEGFTEDWAVIKVNNSQIDSTNFIGNAIDLGTDLDTEEFTSRMYPYGANPTSFNYPGDRLLKFSGMISDEEMWKPNPRTLDQDNDAVIMVIKRGYASGLTIGRLNNIRSFTRYYFEGEPGEISKEVTVLPRNSKSGKFSLPGDSGSAVVDGRGRLAGLLTGGAGTTDTSDCTYITSINFLRKRMILHNLKPNFFPLPSV